MLLVAIHAIADYCDIVVLGVKSAVQCFSITTVADVFLSFASLFWSVSEFSAECIVGVFMILFVFSKSAWVVQILSLVKSFETALFLQALVQRR